MPKKVILCVDDEQIILQSLKAQIKKHFGDRYIYEFAESGDEAWELIEELTKEGIDILLIVSDWLMPNIRGDQFLIKVHQRFPHIVTVMLTGQASEEAIARTNRNQEARTVFLISRSRARARARAGERSIHADWKLITLFCFPLELCPWEPCFSITRPGSVGRL